MVVLVIMSSVLRRDPSMAGGNRIRSIRGMM